jgi:hypothetical protein
MAYRSALAIEFDATGLSYVREASVLALDKGRSLGSTQLITYLAVTQKRIGLLINFNSRLLKDGIQRIIR